MSRFPKISETFVLYEILALEELGCTVEVFPLLRERQPVVHADVDRLSGRVHYLPFLSGPIILAQLHFLLRRPLRYLRVLGECLTGVLERPAYFGKSLVLFPKIVRMAYEIERAGVTHVHAHFATHPAYAALVVHRLTGIDFSFTAHGSDIHVHAHRFRLREKITAATFVRTVSSYNKAFMIEECGPDIAGKIEVVHCGIDPTFFTARAERRANDGPFTVICVASFEEVKGHGYLIDACAMLARKGVDFRCDLVGDGPGRDEVLTRIAEHDLEDRIIVHGAQKRERVAAMLQAADVLILPSVLTARGDREGIPVAIMEAMAVELPVVSSKLSGIPELVDDEGTGILVPPRDTGGLAAALVRLERDPALRRRMGRAGRRKIFREFDLRENTAQLVELLVGRKPLDSPAAPVRARTVDLESTH